MNRSIGHYQAWTPDEDAAMLAGIAAGHPYAVIARQIGRTERAVGQRAMTLRTRTNSTASLPAKRSKWSTQELDILRTMRAAGASHTDIAAAIRRTPAAVKKRMDALSKTQGLSTEHNQALLAAVSGPWASPQWMREHARRLGR